MSDKAAHFLIYGGLGGALVRALAGGRTAAMGPRRILFAVVLATLYGVTDEIHQSFVPPRTPDVLDVAADAVGALAGAIAIAVIARAAVRAVSAVIARPVADSCYTRGFADD